MGFLSPWFLGGLLGVGLPLYVHLLRQHKSNPMPFSSLMFFERRTQSSIKHRRLRYLALLALRLALLLLIVLAFANPFFTRPVAGLTGDRLLIVALDDSFSMRAATRLADAKQAAIAVIDSRNASDRVQVMALDANVKLL